MPRAIFSVSLLVGSLAVAAPAAADTKEVPAGRFVEGGPKITLTAPDTIEEGATYHAYVKILPHLGTPAQALDQYEFTAPGRR